MSKTKLNCENCGSVLTKIETDDKTYICLHCGCKVVVEPDINKTVNNYQVEQNITKNIYGTEKEEYEELIYKAETFIKLENYSKALNYIEQAINENPGSYFAWWLSAKTKLLKGIDKISNFTGAFFKVPDESFSKDYDNIMKLAPEDKKAEIAQEYQELKNRFYEALKEKGQGCHLNNNYVSANYEKQRMPNYYKILRILLCFGLFLMVLGVIMAVSLNTPPLYVLVFYGVIFIVIGIAIKKNYDLDNKIIMFIEQYDKITAKQIADNFDIPYNTSFEKTNFENKLKSYIDKGWLCGYEYNAGVLSKVKK